MAVESLLQRARAKAETLMVDTCTLEHPAGETNPGGGVVTEAWGVPYYQGVCRIQVEQDSGQAVVVGQSERIVTRRVLQLPMAAATAGLTTGDRVTITAAALDPGLAGNTYLVRDVLEKTHMTARRAVVTEVTS